MGAATGTTTGPRHPGDPVTISGVLTGALAIYRRHFLRVALSAVPVFAAIGALSLGILALEVQLAHGTDGTRFGAFLLLVIGAGFVRSLGTVVYSGFLDEAVGADLDGRTPPAIFEAIRDLPAGRLLVADLVTTIAVGLATAFLVLPGLAVLTLVGIVGPVINTERHGVRDGIRRSVSLVSRRFWTCAALLIPLAFVEHAVEGWFVLTVEGVPVVSSVVLGVVLGVTIGATVGLIEVVLAHGLMRADRAVASRAT